MGHKDRGQIQAALQRLKFLAQTFAQMGIKGREVAEPSQTELGRFQKSGVACLKLKLAQSPALLIRQVFLQHQLQARRYKIVGLAADSRNQDIEGFPRFDTRVLVDHRIDCTVQK